MSRRLSILVIVLVGTPLKLFAGNSPKIKAIVADDLLGNISYLISFYLIPIAFALILVVFLWGLVKFVWSASSDEQAKGKSLMVWGVVALFVASAVWGIVYLLASLFGVDANKKDELNPKTTVQPAIR